MATLDITVNGTTLDAGDAPPQTNLLTWLRSRGLTAAKEGCAEGECGACAVLLVRPDAAGARYEAVNSCLVTIGALHGVEVVTVEGLGTPEALHPAQSVMASGGGSQCGYCTPGFVASLAGEFYRPDRTPGQHGWANGVQIEALAGNLCRCTGYRPIRDAAASLPAPDPADPLAERVRHPAQPPRPVALDHPAGAIHRPASLAEALALLADNEDAAPLAGGTDLGVEANLRGRSPRLLVAVDALPELRILRITASHVEIGAGLTLSAIERGLAGRVPLLDQLWRLFASPLIRNAATIGGNLGTASPIGDTSPALLALGASVVLVGQAGEREVPLADYFTGYRTTLRGRDELIAAVRLPLPPARHTAFHKIAKRRQDDISSVAVAYALDLDDGLITRASIGLGGVAATPLRALATENALVGRPWTAETIAAASTILEEEGTPLDDARASAAYRRAMLGRSLHQLFAELRTSEGARA